MSDDRPLSLQGDLPSKMTLTAAMAGMASGDQGAYRLRDLWAHEDLLNVLSAKHDVTVAVKPHGVVMLKLTKV